MFQRALSTSLLSVTGLCVNNRNYRKSRVNKLLNHIKIRITLENYLAETDVNVYSYVDSRYRMDISVNDSNPDID